MTDRIHERELIAEIKPEWGPLGHLIVSADNRSCALYCGGETAEEEEPDPSATIREMAERARQDGKERIVFNGRVQAESDGGHREMLPALSPDGRQLAVARLIYDGAGFRYEIDVNGQPTHRCEKMFFIYTLAWLSDSRLAWYGWFKNEDGRSDKEGGHHYFVNGQDVTGQVMFEGVWADRGRHALIVQENGVRFTLNDDSSREHERPACCDSFLCHCRWDPDQPRPAGPEEIRDEGRSGVRVSFNGLTGPEFDEIENDSGLRSYCLNRDGSRVGYVGIKYSEEAKQLGDAAGKMVEQALERERRGEEPSDADELALALFNPYFGAGYAAIESSKRYYPVNGDRAWRRGYEFADDHFFTPADELVVTACEGRGKMIVIDEDEGPLFDEVYNVRHLAAENCVCYLARKGDKLYRVTVK